MFRLHVYISGHHVMSHKGPIKELWVGIIGYKPFNEKIHDKLMKTLSWCS